MRFTKPHYAIKWSKRPFHDMDINRELVPPSTNIWMLEGGVGVRCDDDFWSIAYLPWEPYHRMSIEEIAHKIWPETIGDDTLIFRPDAGDPWWNERWAEDTARIRAFDGPAMPGVDDAAQ